MPSIVLPCGGWRSAATDAALVGAELRSSGCAKDIEAADGMPEGDRQSPLFEELKAMPLEFKRSAPAFPIQIGADVDAIAAAA